MDGGQMNNPMNPLCYQFIAGGEDPLLLGGMTGIQQPPTGIRHMDWNPATMLDNLTFIEEKIRQVKDVIRTMASDDGNGNGDGGGSAQQQVVNDNLTCLIVQLMSTAGSLLPLLKNSSFLTRPVAGAGASAQPTANLAAGESSCSAPSNAAAVFEDESKQEMGSPDYEALFNGLTDGAEAAIVDDCTVLAAVGDPPPEASEVILQLEEDEILAPHTHFCGVCGKGFKRDANLRMHMRGHGDEYKSAAALARPPRDAASAAAEERLRYSCPFAGCKRNREHAAFQPLKTLMCVKNHYKRSHCEKRHVCGVCGGKRFSVVADLKTHEKHCGRHRWLCSCGTSFSRKDKLFAHVALFQHGHSPALPPSSPAPVLQPTPETNGGFVWGSSSGGAALADIKAIGGGEGDDFLSTGGNFGEQFDFGFGQLDDGYEGSSLAMLLQDGGK